MPRYEVRQGAETFRALGSKWDDLVADSRVATPFHGRLWQETWWRHLGRRSEPRFLVAWEGKDLVGLYSTMRSTGPWRSLRSLGIGPSDYLHPLVRDGYEAIAKELVYLAQTQSDVDLVDLHQIREDEEFTREAIGTRVLQATCLQMDLPASFDTYVGGLSRSLRSDIRRGQRMRERGEIQIVSAGPGETDRFLDAFFELHRRRWRSRSLPGAFLGRLVPFQREWCARAIAQGGLHLDLLLLDGTPIGGYFGFSRGDRAYYYQAGMDPAYSRISPGTLLLANGIKRAIDEGRTLFDLMRGDEPYKRRWKPTRERRNFRFVLPRTGARATVASRMNLASFRLEARVRARLETR